MKLARRFSHAQRSPRRDPRLLLSLCILSAQCLAACGSSDAGFSAAGAEVAGSAPISNAAGAPVTAGASSTPAAGSDGESTQGGGGSANGGADSSSGGSAAAGMAGSVAAPGGASGTADACSSSDACTSCLCGKCPAQVMTCEATPGCQEIANCVATNRCDGIACYCGTADTLSCAAGKGNGPCRDVILNAPGGRKPTIANQSAGPAADAATALGTCGTKNGACSASCQ